jgi:translation initiation factor 1A
MVKNKFGGNRAKKGKNSTTTNATRELLFRSDDQDYATVITILGGNRLKVICNSDSQERIAKICGTLVKRVWINKDDTVLVSLRESTKGVECDVIHKYTPDETRMLRSYGEIVNPEKNNEETPDDILFTGEIEFEIDDI